MRTRSLRAMAHKYAATVGRNARVRVIFQGNQAMTDGRTVIIPELAPGTAISEPDAHVVLGYLDHETGHVRWTDNAFYEAASKSRDDEVFSWILNVIEDIWIENRHIQEYPGAKGDLDAVELRLRVGAGAIPRDEQDRVMSLLYKELWSKYRGIYGGITAGWLEDEPELLPIAKLLEKEMPGVASTAAAVQLADKVRQLLKKHVEKKEGPGAGQRPGMSGTVGFGLAMAQGPQGSQPGNGVNGVVPNGLPSGIKGDGSTDTRKAFLMDLLNAIKQQAQADEDGPSASNNRGSFTASNQQKKDGTWLPPRFPDSIKVKRPDLNEAAYFRRHDTIAPELSAAKKMLAIFLKASSRRGWNRGLEEGELDESRLYSIFTDSEPRVMKEKRISRHVNSAAELLVDLSGSMPSEETAQAAIMISEGLDAVPKVKFSVSGFESRDRGSWNAADDKPGFGRIDDLLFHVFKEYEAPYRKERYRLGSMNSGGFTPLGEAYGLGLDRLLERKEPRRVLFIVSDGDPYLSRVADRSHSDYPLMRQCNGRAKRLGIETVGIYVGTSTSSLEGYVQRHFRASSTAELAQVMLRVIRETFV